MIWVAGFFAALSQITYPSVSSFLSLHCDGDKQGAAQGMLAGIRGLCQGLGPALFGLIFYVFNVDLSSTERSPSPIFTYTSRHGNAVRDQLFTPVWNGSSSVATASLSEKSGVAGPPFIVGALLVSLAIFAVRWLQSVPHFRNMPSKVIRLSSDVRRQSLSYSPLIKHNSQTELFVPRSRVSPSTLSVLRDSVDGSAERSLNDF
ncbi:unnamed protein product [Soboliphyme baturini]|uniref:Autophagy-related protein n=1 Tax=Soboliphyme baturini TaxID=241478 RepID=A0A183IZH0_9BILA|nr:unnamed protein product [Soboliphyme baturini]